MRIPAVSLLAFLLLSMPLTAFGIPVTVNFSGVVTGTNLSGITASRSSFTGILRYDTGTSPYLSNKYNSFFIGGGYSISIDNKYFVSSSRSDINITNEAPYFGPETTDIFLVRAEADTILSQTPDETFSSAFMWILLQDFSSPYYSIDSPFRDTTLPQYLSRELFAPMAETALDDVYINFGGSKILTAHISTIGVTPSTGANPVPEPSVFLLFGTGLILIVVVGKKHKKTSPGEVV